MSFNTVISACVGRLKWQHALALFELLSSGLGFWLFLVLGESYPHNTLSLSFLVFGFGDNLIPYGTEIIRFLGLMIMSSATKAYEAQEPAQGCSREAAVVGRCK